MRKVIMIIMTVGLAAILFAADYTPRSIEGANLQMGIGAEQIDVGYTWVDDFFSAGYKANAAITNCAVGTIWRGGKFSEAADEGEWLVTVTDGDGDNGEAVKVADDAVGGWLEILCNNKALDTMNVQLNGESFGPTSSKDLWYEIKMNIDDVSADMVWVGLTVADTDVMDSFGNDFIGFYVTNGTCTFQSGKDGVLATNSVTTFDDGASAGTNAKRLGFHVDGSTSNVVVYLDGAPVATNLASGKLPLDEAISPIMAIRTTDTGADSLFVDYIKVVGDR
jgi:hypothetical protein